MESIFFDFKPDNKCSITWADDVSYEISDGYYYTKDSIILLEPLIRPDSIRISQIYDNVGNCKNCLYLEKQQNADENVFWLLTLNDKRLQNIKTIVYQKDNQVVELTTDRLGYATYYGAIADSICFSFQNRMFKVYPSEKHQPSFIKVYIDLNYKDLFDRIKELKSINNNYWYTYKCDNGLRKSLLRKGDGHY